MISHTLHPHSGTEAMFNYLNAHPSVTTAKPHSQRIGPTTREIAFFGIYREYYTRGMDHYENITRAHDAPRPVVVDCTPQYMQTMDVPKQIKHAYGAFKVRKSYIS